MSDTASTLNDVPVVNDNPRLQAYYSSFESRAGYRLILGGTRHFGYYDSPSAFPFPIGRALRRMEERLLEILDLPKGSHLVDAGCGVGHVALFMARHGMNVTGIDVVDRHIQKAQNNVNRAVQQDSSLAGRVTVQKMDYHHLETIADASYEGVYTTETFVHATDPQAVLNGFFRILRPGGRIAMLEYDHVPYSDSSSGSLYSSRADLAHSMDKVNEYAAMPTNTAAVPGSYKDWLETAGFENVEIRDYSANIRPMLWLFWLLAAIPYFFIKLLHLEKYFINTVAGYQAYRGNGFWRYLAITATKPGGPIDTPKTK